RAAMARPRGAARTSALAALLTGSDIDAPRAAAALGLPAEGRYRVALAAPGTEAPALQRFLAPIGMVHDAGEIDGATTAIVELRGESGRPKLSRTIRGRNGVGAQRGWVALSGLAMGGPSLPATAREARFVAALLEASAITGPVACFDVLDDLGPYRLLYRLWGTPDLSAFTTEALGDLISGDRRGTLRETLLAYLAAGGSHVEAAARLGIHRNTLAYRLKQIASLTGHEPTDPNTRLVLHLALLAAALPPAPSGVA
ncbi:MAG: PucR family transcriptional regulator, partial [Thermomicrobiales bacterium]